MHIISVMVIGAPNLSCHIHPNICACDISFSAFNNFMVGTNAISIFSIVIFLCVCVHMCVFTSVYRYVCICMYDSQRATWGIILQALPTFS